MPPVPPKCLQSASRVPPKCPQSASKVPPKCLQSASLQSAPNSSTSLRLRTCLPHLACGQILFQAFNNCSNTRKWLCGRKMRQWQGREEPAGFLRQNSTLYCAIVIAACCAYCWLCLWECCACAVQVNASKQPPADPAQPLRTPPGRCKKQARTEKDRGQSLSPCTFCFLFLQLCGCCAAAAAAGGLKVGGNPSTFCFSAPL